jgi:aromatic-L-amino-acid/L-tryptophan decarboxylase
MSTGSPPPPAEVVESTHPLPALPSSPELFSAQLAELAPYLHGYLAEQEGSPAAAYIDQIEDPLAHEESLRASQALLEEHAPREGQSLHSLLEVLFGPQVLGVGMNHGSPGFAAFIGGGGLPQSALADLVAGVLNRFVGVWMTSPGLVTLESNVIRWLCEVVGMQPHSAAHPEQRAFGLFTSGGSMANFLAVVTARRCLIDEAGVPLERATLYTSSQTHHCVAKGAMLAGLPLGNVRQVEVDPATCAMRVDRLHALLEEDCARGLTPFFVCGTGGTTNTGAVDDLQALRALADRFGVWFHVDGCYGGFFRLTKRGCTRLVGIESADSVSIDPHKTLFLPQGVGALLVRDRTHLSKAMYLSSAYMPTVVDHPHVIDFHELGPELTVQPRGLKLWLPIKLFGLQAFARCLDEKLDLAEHLAECLRPLQHIEVLFRPQLTVVVFRLCVPTDSTELANHRNRFFLREINRRRTVFLSPTTLQGRFVIRACFLNFRTHLVHVDAAVESIRQASLVALGHPLSDEAKLANASSEPSPNQMPAAPVFSSSLRAARNSSASPATPAAQGTPASPAPPSMSATHAPL